MGQVFTSLFSRKPACDVYVDIENAKPSEAEQKTYSEVKDILGDNASVMKTIVEYKGCSDLCRNAMQNPSKETELAAFEGLLTALDAIQEIHMHSKAIGKATRLLLTSLGKEDAKQTLEDQQALVKQFGDLLVFVIDFDQKRLMCPQLSNDFAFYRRLLSKFPKHPDVKVKAEEASAMALFTARPYPMITSMCTEAEESMQSNETILPMIGMMANACYNMLSKKSFESKETNLFLAKAMTGAIVLYDRVSPTSVFLKSSHVHIKDVIKLLKKDFKDDVYLLNEIKYYTKTYDEAPDSIKGLLN